MHSPRVAGIVITALILSALFSGCISGPAQKTASPAGGMMTEAARTDAPRTPHLAAAEPANLPAGTREHTFEYVLNGVKGSVSVALSDSIYAEYEKKGSPEWKSPVDAASNSSYFLAFMTDPAQQPAIGKLAQAIEEKTMVKDDQARIAVSLVQHIPYKDSEKFLYPYEVLYRNQGVCGEKSLLLALLLKDLGFGSSVLYLLPEDHMTAGIKAEPPYDFRNSGYAFIEATEPYIITDSTTDNLARWKFTNTLEVTPAGTGQALGSIESDYNDARNWAVLEGKIKSLSSSEYGEWQALDKKYDLSYYT
jgi:hypothetical protein